VEVLLGGLSGRNEHRQHTAEPALLSPAARQQMGTRTERKETERATALEGGQRLFDVLVHDNVILFRFFLVLVSQRQKFRRHDLRVGRFINIIIIIIISLGGLIHDLLLFLSILSPSSSRWVFRFGCRCYCMVGFYIPLLPWSSSSSWSFSAGLVGLSWLIRVRVRYCSSKADLGSTINYGS